MKEKTRFAPSPTGFIHIGNVRTALFSLLYSKNKDGIFFLRIDDTDIVRNNNIYLNNIFFILKWLNITYDNEIIFQSKRFKKYEYILNDLLKKKYVYKCFCSKDRLQEIKNFQIKNGLPLKYDGKCKNEIYSNVKYNNFIIRVDVENFFYKNNTNILSFYDEIKGTILINNNNIDDFIIAKNNFLPTYNFASVIDDIELEITSIIRGDDHIINTHKQVILFKLLEKKLPKFIHLPMILDEDKKPLSKRNNDSDINIYYKNGFLNTAIINYLFTLGFSFENKEIFSLNDMINIFDTKYLSSSPSIFNKDKLIWFNKYYIKSSNSKIIKNNLIRLIKKKYLNFKIGPDLITLIEISKNRVQNIIDIINNYEFLFKDKNNVININENDFLTLNLIYSDIKNSNFEWNFNNIKLFLEKFVIKYNYNFSKIAVLLRKIITFSDKPNSLYEILILCGKVLLLKRIRNIIYQSKRGL
jgi:glutamyl-tRNA synthetase